MQHRRRMIGYAIPEEIAADCLFETQGNVAEAQRLARRYIVGEGRRRARHHPGGQVIPLRVASAILRGEATFPASPKAS